MSPDELRWTDETKRLAWREGAIADLGERLDHAGREFWAELEAESDRVLAGLGDSADPEEIAPLPEGSQVPDVFPCVGSALPSKKCLTNGWRPFTLILDEKAPACLGL